MTCGTVHWLSEGVSSPSKASSGDLIFCWLLLGPFPELPVDEGLKPSDPKDFLETGAGECLNVLQCCNCGSPSWKIPQDPQIFSLTCVSRPHFCLEILVAKQSHSKCSVVTAGASQRHTVERVLQYFVNMR